MSVRTSRFRKTAAAAVLLLAAAVGYALVPSGFSPLPGGFNPLPADATATFAFTRLGGADRYETAKLIAENSFPSGADTALVATGTNFPDALAGGYLAGNKSGPILLTPKDALSPFTASALASLKIKNVTILGGTVAVSAAVEMAIAARDSTNAAGGKIVVTRVAGLDRYETAKLLATSGGTVGTVVGKKTAILATGEKYADALAAGPLAYGIHLPVLLTKGAPSTTLDPNTKAALTTLGIQKLIVLGGEAALTAAVVTEASNGGVIDVSTRLAGTDRYDTAAKLADYALTTLSFVNDHVNLARGDDPTGFADALAGGPHAGKENSVIVLTAPTALSAPTKAWLTAHMATLQDGHIFGLTGAISAAVQSAATAAAGGPTPSPSAN